VDRPECPSGALGILAQVAAAIPNPNYRLAPSRLESVATIRMLLSRRIEESYQRSNALVPSMNPEAVVLLKQSHVQGQKRPLKLYTLFLQETEEGRKISGLAENALDNDTIEATVEAVLDECHLSKASM